MRYRLIDNVATLIVKRESIFGVEERCYVCIELVCAIAAADRSPNASRRCKTYVRLMTVRSIGRRAPT